LNRGAISIEDAEEEGEKRRRKRKGGHLSSLFDLMRTAKAREEGKGGEKPVIF